MTSIFGGLNQVYYNYKLCTLNISPAPEGLVIRGTLAAIVVAIVSIFAMQQLLLYMSITLLFCLCRYR